jgi:hypothetical protein
MERANRSLKLKLSICSPHTVAISLREMQAGRYASH